MPTIDPSSTHPIPPGPPTSGSIPRATWEALAAPFSLDEMSYLLEADDQRDTHAIIEFIPYYWAIIERLNGVLGPGGYSYTLDVQPTGTCHIATCHLQIGGIWRSGVHRYYAADESHARLALTRAAQNFHVGWQARHLGHVAVTLPVDFSELPEWVPGALQGEGLVSPLVDTEPPEETKPEGNTKPEVKTESDDADASGSDAASGRAAS